MLHSNRLIIGATLGVGVLFIIFVGTISQLGFFNFDSPNGSEKIVAAAIALVGGFASTLVSLIGVFIKYSIDQRNVDLKEQAEERIRIESDRNDALQRESEQRLKLEAAIEAVKLLGDTAPVTQRAGVLFTLANLGMLNLAITMLDPMLSTKRLDANTTAWLINEAVQTGQSDLQHQVSSIMRKHADQFLMPNGQSSFPSSFNLVWNTDLPVIVREDAAEAIVRVVLARPHDQWDPDMLNTFVVTLSLIWQTEPRDLLRYGVGLCLERIIQIYPPENSLHPASGSINIDDLKADLKKVYSDNNVQTYDSFMHLCDQTEVWLQQAALPHLQPAD